VVGVTNRYTGDFILELNETATDVLPFIHAARDSAGDEDARYRVEIDVDGERLVTYDKHTFLVYDHGEPPAQREPDPVRRRLLTGRRASSADDPSEIGTENKATYPLCSTGQQSNYEIS